MARAEQRTRETGMLLNEGARPMVSDEITSCEMKEGIRPRAMNMIVPLASHDPDDGGEPGLYRMGGGEGLPLF